LFALTEYTDEWAEAVRRWTEMSARHRTHADRPDASAQYLLWQTLVGAWQDGPIETQRLLDFLQKATREAKLHTSWTHPDEEYDTALAEFATAVVADTEVMADVARFCDVIAPAARVTILGQKLVQLTMPGIPDVYQGCEVVNLSLVDPDNRRAVDYQARRTLLAQVDAAVRSTVLRDSAARRAATLLDLSLDAEKLLVTSVALRLRRANPRWFVGDDCLYSPVATSAGNAVAFGRGSDDRIEVITVVTRLPVALTRNGGWSEHTIALPEGQWQCAFTGREYPAGSTRLVDVLARLPVAVLVRTA
jgi:(1->4)-alpha-D-glucan 1-alpha-D-glucosylmutase